MRLSLFILLLCPFLAFTQSAPLYGTAVGYVNGTPTFTPNTAQKGSELCVSINNKMLYLWNRDSSEWKPLGGITVSFGVPSTAPAAAGGTRTAINMQTGLIYWWNGTVWKEIIAYSVELAGTTLIDSLARSGWVSTADLADGAVTWVKLAQAVKDSINAGGSGGSPTGAAGGDLTGTYPNPLIGNDKVISANVLDGTLVNADLASQTIDSNKVKNRAIPLLKIAPSGATNGQVPKYNTTTGNWEPGADNNSGGGSNFIDIANYSPTGNGIANDSTAFAQAIAAAVAGGYKKIFLNGKNYYARGINNPYGVEFFGGGLIRFGVDSIAYIAKDKSERLSFGQEYLSAWQKKVIANANDTIRVVYSGDSTTEGGEFVAKTTQYLTDLTGLVFKSFNRGYSAQTTTRWDTLYLKQDTAAIPTMDLYVVRWGINDGFFNLGLASFQTRLRSGLAKLRAWKNSTALGIVLMTPNATSYSGTKSNEAWHDQINAIIRQAARDYQCFFFDTYSLMKDANSSRGLLTWLDNVETHPNTYAQRLIAGELAKAIVPQYLVRPPGTDFRSTLQANTLPLTTTPDAFVNGVTFRLNSNSAGSWPTDGIVITSKSPNAALQYLFPAAAGQAGSKPWTRYGNTSAWSAWDQRPYTQIGGGVSVVAGNAAPSTYVYDASHTRITDSLNGSLMNFRSIDNITLQLAHSYLTDDLFYRNGFSGSWVGAGFRRVLSLPRASGVAFFSGVATNPNSVQTANVGSLYFCTANGNIWSKLSGSGNTGWVQQLISYSGSGSPESVVTAPVGSIYQNSAGGAGTTFYIKESGVGNTGWIGYSGTATGAAGGDLTGTYPNPTVGANKIVTSYVLDGTLLNADLASQTVDSNKIKNGVITTVKLEDNAVTSAKIASQTVDSLDVKNRSITTIKIEDNAINSAKVASQTLDSADVKNRGVTLLKLAQSGATNGQVAQFNSTTGNWEAATLATTTAKRDTTIYVTDSDYNFASAVTSANILARYNRVIIYSKLSASASSDNQIFLHTASSDFLQCTIEIYSEDASADADETSADFTTNGAVNGTGGTVSAQGITAGQTMYIRAIDDGGYKWKFSRSL